MDKPHIRINENGSYLVTGGVPLVEMVPVENENGERISWQYGNSYPHKEKYSLCRCGLSKNKPYCDATHKQISFDSELNADRQPSETRWKVYEGQGIQMTDDESLCAGSFCDPFGSVWGELEEDYDEKIRERTERQIKNCPSGRLQYFVNGKGPVEDETKPEIAAIPDGPLRILGGIPVEAPDGFVYPVRNRVLLCRCGHSRNKPFCDGTHASINFKTKD